MATRQFELSEDQAAALQHAFLHEKDGPTRTRYQAVRLYGIGYRLTEVLDITGCSRTSLFDWCRRYRHEGPQGLVDKRAGGNSRKLTPEQIEDLTAKLHRYRPWDLFGGEASPYWSVAALRRALAHWYGVHYKQPASYHGLFRRCGFSYQRPAKVHTSRCEQDVLEFEQRLEKKLLDLVQEAPETVILAEDEASLYLQATLERVWAPRGSTPVVYASPSRTKTNFYGSLNLATGEVITTRSGEMNAEATARHLREVLAAVPERPILLLWDRAPWHRGAAIRALLAEHPRLEVMRFPVASPELNPQEQVWKATRHEVSHNHAWSRLDQVADAFEEHLETTRFPCSLLDRYGFTALRPMFT